MADGSLIVLSKVKAVISAAGLNTAGDFGDALSGAVEGLVKDAVKRAKSNGRKTVRAGDL